jgi:hypothetical protein
MKSIITISLNAIIKKKLTTNLIVLSGVFFCFFAPPQSFAQYNALDWGVYFSDSSTGFTYADDELIDDIKIDNQNPENIYVVGRTRSSFGTSIPCPGKTLNYGTGDVVVAKYNRCGELQWSKYLGNKKKTDYGYSLALDYDALGNTWVYIAGEMKTNNGTPKAAVCDGGVQPFKNKPVGTWDGFIAKYDQNGALQRYTFFGGKDSTGEKVDQILGLAIYDHKVFVVGYTESPDLYKGAVVLDDSVFDGSGDGFLAEFSSDLHTLKYFTYIGGFGVDRCHGVKIFSSETSPAQVFVDGTTPSATGIFAGAGFDSTLSGELDAFVGKWEDIDADGKFTKTWCTYLGGVSIERARDMDFDASGNVILVGQTLSRSIPWCSNGYDSTFNGMDDAFVVKIPNAGGYPIWGTYFGGYANEEAVGLVWKHGITEDHVVIGGITYSSQKTSCLPNPNPNNFTVFPLQSPLMGLINGKKGVNYCPGMQGDAFIAEFSDKAVGQSLIVSSYIGGSGNEINGSNQLSYNPSFAVTPTGELYMAFNSQSNDVKKQLGYKLQKQYGEFHGGVDAYVARLIDTTSAQYNCIISVAPLKEEESTIMNESISVYPNPSNQQFNVKVFADEESDISFRILDNIGRVVLSQSEHIPAGANISSLSLSGYADGMYLLQVQYLDKVYNVKLIKH